MKKFIYVISILVCALVVMVICNFCKIQYLTAEYGEYGAEILKEAGIEFDVGTVQITQIRKLTHMEMKFKCDGKRKQAYVQYPFKLEETDIVVTDANAGIFCWLI